MIATRPEISDQPMYQLLRAGNMEEFNRLRSGGEECDLRGLDFRAVDLRGLEAEGLDLRDSYFRMADLRGLDLSRCDLRGASLRGAKISGTLFPPELPAEEIRLSVEFGTRLRYSA